jgi:hypothetical protein
VHLGLAVAFFFYFYPLWTGLPISISANDASPGTPIWGPKMWLVNCKANLPASQPQLWCWS